MQNSLEIAVLGELEVRHEGRPLALPQSRKTRALLAYLALTGRSHRRDRLSGMFWDVADDARAALRWSLTKLRRVVNAGGVQRLQANRSHVELPTTAVSMDLARVRAAMRPGAPALSTEALTELAATFRGELLDGMFLPDFDEFEAWLEAERVVARGMRVRMLRELVRRLAACPEAGLPYARAWLQATGGADPDARRAVESLSLEVGGRPTAWHASPEPSLSVISATGLRRSSTPFVVREPELACLQELVGTVRAGAGARVMVVRGAPGQGKTRLLMELAQREEACILHGECHEAERSRSYGPFVDALRRLDERLLPGEGVEVLDSLRSPCAQGIADTDALFRGFATLIRSVGDRCGLCLLLIDDAHLLDESSSELLHYVVRANAATPLVVVVGCRIPDLRDNAPVQRCLRGLARQGVTDELDLAPLPGSEIQRLVEAAAPDAAAALIASRSAGNPFFALELARSPADHIPPSLTDAISGRLGTLEPQAQALVRWVSVFDRAQLEHLEAVATSEVSDLVSATEEAERYGFIHLVRDDHGTRVEMVHDLLRQVVEESLSAVRRAAMHRAVAAHLSQLPVRAELAPVIAHHAVLADNPGLAVRACREAAERSAAWKGIREAEELVQLGLRHAEQLDAPERQEHQIELLQILLRVRRPSDVEELVDRLMTLGTEATDLGRVSAGQLAFHLVGYLRWDTDNPWRAQQGVLQAMQVSWASSGDRAVGLASSAMCLALLEQDLPRADALLAEAELHARSLPQPPIEIPVARGLLHRHRGAIVRARDSFGEARAIARAAGDRPSEARAIEHEMLLELEVGNAGAVRGLARSLADLGPRIREGGEGPLAAGVLALIESGADELDHAVAPALAELHRLDDKRRLGVILNRLARRELALGRLAAAKEHAGRAWELAQRMQRPSEAAIAAALLMAVATRESDDASFAAAEERLTELESEHNLSAEARGYIERATGSHPPAEGATPWSS